MCGLRMRYLPPRFQISSSLTTLGDYLISVIHWGNPIYIQHFQIPHQNHFTCFGLISFPLPSWLCSLINLTVRAIISHSWLSHFIFTNFLLNWLNCTWNIHCFFDLILTNRVETEIVFRVVGVHAFSRSSITWQHTRTIL